MGQIGFRWEPVSTLSVEIAGTGAVHADLNSAERDDIERFPPNGTPGWVTVDLRTNWQARQNLHLTAAIENLTNTEYRYHSSGTNQPGTSVVLGVQVKF